MGGQTGVRSTEYTVHSTQYTVRSTQDAVLGFGGLTPGQRAGLTQTRQIARPWRSKPEADREGPGADQDGSVE